MTSVNTTPFLHQVKSLLGNIAIDQPGKSHLVPAAVMLLLFEKDGQYYIIFNKRSQEVEHHKGEISFPGGAYDKNDIDLIGTALRETWEEMGIDPVDVEVLGQLSELETRSNFRVVPFVGAFPYPYEYRANPVEVEEVLEVPLAHLQSPDNQWRRLEYRDGVSRVMYYYRYEKHVIWGVTGHILHEFLETIG